MTFQSKIGRTASLDLLVDLPAELLRAVRLRVALRGLGKEWRQINESKWRPHLTQRTQHFDFFLSHDWGTSGRMKYFSLLMFFNSKASAVLTFLCSSVLGVLCGLEILPKTVWWLILGHIVSLLTFFFWQHVRDLFKLRLVFLDRLCIPQQDEELKSQCIYGLASFLERSDTLLVLWSPRYCTRLWCMYEIGCFLLKQKDNKNKGSKRRRVRFLPVQMCVLWLLCYLQVAAIFATALVAQRVPYVFDWKTVTGQLSLAGVIVIQVLVLYPAYFYIMNSMLRDVDQMPKLFRDFRLEGAECFCCSCGHKHPVTMEEVACDRQLIYEVLRHWSGESDDIQTVFKTHLDEHVMPSVEQTFQSPALFMRPLMSAVLSASSPFIGEFISVEFTLLIEQWEGNVFREAGLPVYVFFISLCLVRCSLLLGRLGARRSKSYPGSVVLLQVLAFLCTSLLLGVGYSLAVAFGTQWFDFRPINLLPFGLLSLVMLWSIYLYTTNRSKWSKMSVAKGGDSQPTRKVKKEVTQEPTHMDELMCKIDSRSTFGI
eukprot:s49_g21.t1